MQTPLNPKQNDFQVCRVLQGCALVGVASFDRLRQARTYMRSIAAHVPNSYLVFSKRSHRVVARI